MARATLTAAAYGTGLLLIGVFLLQMYLTAATGSTESLGAAAARLSGWLLTGTLAVAVGVRLRKAER